VYIRLTAFYSGQPEFYWSNRWRGGSDISWTIRKSLAHHLGQITTPVPYHSVFTSQMPFPLPNQRRQITDGKYCI